MVLSIGGRDQGSVFAKICSDCRTVEQWGVPTWPLFQLSKFHCCCKHEGWWKSQPRAAPWRLWKKLRWRTLWIVLGVVSVPTTTIGTRKLEAFANVSDVDGLDALEAASGLDCKIGVSWSISVLDGLDFRTRYWRLTTIKVTKAWFDAILADGNCRGLPYIHRESSIYWPNGVWNPRTTLEEPSFLRAKAPFLMGRVFSIHVSHVIFFRKFYDSDHEAFKNCMCSVFLKPDSMHFIHGFIHVGKRCRGRFDETMLNPLCAYVCTCIYICIYICMYKHWNPWSHI